MWGEKDNSDKKLFHYTYISNVFCFWHSVKSEILTISLINQSILSKKLTTHSYFPYFSKYSIMLTSIKVYIEIGNKNKM